MQTPEDYLNFVLRHSKDAGHWQEYCDRHESIRGLEYTAHLRISKLDADIYAAVRHKNLRNMSILKDFKGKLNADNYCEIQLALSKMEETYHAINMRQFDVLDYKIEIKNQETNEVSGINYVDIEIEGISKIQPPLLPRDIVIVTSEDSCDLWEVKSIQGETIRLAIRFLEDFNAYVGTNANILFIRHESVYSHYEKAIEMVKNNTFIRKNVFLHIESVTDYPSHIKLGLYKQADERLNNLDNDQCQAVEAIVSVKLGSMPYILLGPPGTGKTHTLIEAVAQISERNRDSRILFCAKSVDSVNRVVTQLKKLNGNMKIHKFTRDEEAENLWSVTTTVTTIEESPGLMGLTHFDYVIIDDACGSSELETLPPICLLLEFGCLVLAGDPKQMSPVSHIRPIVSKLGLHKPLIERALELDLYKKDPVTGKYSNSRYITELLQCHRSHEDIMQVSDRNFYNDRMTFFVEAPSELLKKMKITKPIQFCDVKGKESNPFDPSSWVNETEAECCVDLILKLGQNDYEPDQIGVITPCKSQAMLIATKLRSRTVMDSSERSNCQSSQNGANKHDSQASKKVKSSDYSSCKIDTVEGFQGDERDIIIISTVRSLSPCCMDSNVEGKRFNIAITRAKKLLFVVGNEEALKDCKYWRWFLDNASPYKI